MKVGDRVRVTSVPKHLPTGEVAKDFPLRMLFELCVGRIFPVVGIAEGLAELEVGEIVGLPAYMHSIWLEHESLEIVPMSAAEEKAMSRRHCSFCGKAGHEVKSLLSGPGGDVVGVFICDECVQASVRLIVAAHPDWLDQHIEFARGLQKRGDKSPN